VRRLLLAIVLFTALTACGDDDNDSAGTVARVSSDEPVPTTPVPTTPTTSGPAPASSPSFSATPISPTEGMTTTSLPGFPIDGSSPLVMAAVQDLAQRLGVDPADVTVVDARAVTWGDGSLGCPQPGMQYVQRLVDGTLVILKAGGRTYEYHGGDPLFLCENPRPPSGGGGGTG
jgi:hypothetical protein